MIKDNLIILRNIHGYSQEEVANKLNVSRQAYSKWEKGTSLPDIENCANIASLYNVSIDSLLKTEKSDGIGIIPPAPKGKNIWGTVIVNDRGQIVIPKGAREKFKLSSGQSLVVLSDDEGIVLLPKEKFEKKISKIMEFASIRNDE